MAGPTTLKLGYTNPLTDSFGAHPALGGPLDLNDGVTYTLVSPDGLELAAPPRTLIPTGNIRTQGERVVRALYRHNREAVIRLVVGPTTSYAAFSQTLRTLLAWVHAAPAQPVTIQWQPPSASQPVYLDVVGGACDVSVDEGEWLRQELEPVELVFIVRPGARGDRVVLSNLVTNAGFEQGGSNGASGGTVVFSDSFATASAYTLQAGSAPTVGASVLTMSSASRVGFGSPAWGALALWQVRWEWVTGLNAIFYLHFADVNNYLAVSVTGTSITLLHSIAGTAHTLATASFTLLGSPSWMWLKMTQYPTPTAPTPSNDPAAVSATLYNDNGSGAIGTQVATLGPVPTFDAVTALVGQPAIQANFAALAIGGAFSGVQQIGLWGPGSWLFTGTQGGSTGPAAAAWEQNPANAFHTSQGAPVNSQGAARVDFPPAGTVNSAWQAYAAGTLGPGGTVAGTTAMPTSVGATVHASVWTRSTGLSAGAQTVLWLREFDVNGNLLRSTSLASLTGTQANWAQLAGAVVTGSSTAYVDVQLQTADTSGAGASANATVWFDNAQVWDQTKTGMSAMAYCELRAAQSPCHLLVTGLLGDLPTPALLQWATYQQTWAKGSALTYAIGRRGVVSAGAALAAQAVGYYGSTFTPQGIPVTDASAYGGWYVKASSNNGNTWNPRGFSQLVSDCAGVYHLLTRFKTADASPASVQVRPRTDETLDPWYVDAQALGTLGTYWGPWGNPLGGNGWTVCDVGQVILPPFPTGGMSDPTQLYAVPRGEWNPASGTPVELDCNWLALLPVDGSVVLGVVNNPSNSPIASVANSYVWCYVDGLLVNRAGASLGGPGVGMGLDGASASYSLESVAVPNARHAGGGSGTAGTGAINVNSGGDPYLTLDPTLILPGQAPGAGGINQLLGQVSDSAGDVLGMAVEIAYSPLYVWPR